MILFALLMVFGTASLMTSALAHDELRWRYAAALTVAGAILLTSWSARLLTAGLHHMGYDIHLLMAVLIAGMPNAAVLFNLWIRRKRTPRHTPGPEDDPVLRRYLEEKVRRERRRRQAEALDAAADDGS